MTKQEQGDPILSALDRGVLTITLNRPESRNAMSRSMVQSLIAALDQAEQSDAVRVIVLRGADGNFCAGGDIKDMASARGADGDGIKALSITFGEIARRFSRSPIPSIAVLEGAVMGGGFGIACTVDVVLATRSTTFRLPETSLGVVPAQIAPFLIERLGYSEAKRLAITGAKLDALAAYKVGLVHHIIDDIDAALNAELSRILRGAPRATAATKKLFFALHEAASSADIEHAAEVFSAAARSDEAAAGFQAFITKQSPPWSRNE